MFQRTNNHYDFYRSLDSEFERVGYLANIQEGLSKALNKADRRIRETEEFEQEVADEETFDILAGMFGAIEDFNNLLDCFAEHQSEVLTEEANIRKWQ